MGLFAIEFMTNTRDRVVDCLAHAVDPAQRPMLGDRMPGREREILAGCGLNFMTAERNIWTLFLYSEIEA